MILGIDAGGLLRPDTGIGRYTEELLRGLGRVAPDLEIRLLRNSFRGGPPPREGVPGRLFAPRVPHRLLAALQGTLGWPPVEAFIGDVDVFHTSDWQHPPIRRAARVTTVHDVAPLVHPEWYTPDVVGRHRAMDERTVELADAIVTVSEFTRGELLRLFDVDPARVRAVPNGVAADLRAPEADAGEALRASAGVHGPYLLFVGTREPRKNLAGLVEIARRVLDADVAPDLGVVVAGMRPWAEGQGVQGVAAWSGREDVEDRLEALGMAGRFRFPGQVPMPTLRALYAGAAAFVYPTLYEGFGLPALEAMACGAPVVASSLTAVPEVVGDAGLLADPRDPDAFATEVVRLLGDAGLARDLRERGLLRAASFTWDRTARETLAVYGEATRAR